MKESWIKNSDEQLSFKYFLNISFVREIWKKAVLAATGMNDLIYNTCTKEILIQREFYKFPANTPEHISNYLQVEYTVNIMEKNWDESILRN